VFLLKVVAFRADCELARLIRAERSAESHQCMNMSCMICDMTMLTIQWGGEGSESRTFRHHRVQR
jgi:hypothetical protein